MGGYCRKAVSVSFVLFFSFLCIGVARADIRLPKLVGDNMVLQRDSKITLWGWADPGEQITIELHGQQATATADQHGEWLTSLGPFPAGGPFEMVLKGHNRIHLQNILLGDVWLASGQSNMEFPLKPASGWKTGVINADLEVARADYPQMRLIIVHHQAALSPLGDVASDGWYPVSPQTVGDFSAIAYLFGRELHERYRVPIGVIESNWDGTPAEAWISHSALHVFPEFSDQITAIAQVDAMTRSAYQSYQHQREMWYREHRTEDNGRVGGRNVWADPATDISDWPTIDIPRPATAWGKDFNGFDGVVWFRREIHLPAELAGKPVLLQLGELVENDETYFNGQWVGAMQGYKSRKYVIPGQYVHAGLNIIAVRLVGTHDPINPDESAIGMAAQRDDMYIRGGGMTVPLAGPWHYHPGTDLDTYPVVNPTIAAARPAPKAPTELFNGMIHPLLRMRIKGVIWYQGEANALDNRAEQYRALFPALINDWRQHWGYSVPFLFVQLAGFGPDLPESADCQWSELREAQAMALSLPDTGMATAIDLGDPNNIHPRNKQDVAHRLALAAAKVVYKEEVVSSGPAYESVQLEENRVRIRFSSSGGELVVRDKYGYAKGFEIAGPDNVFRWARARQEGSEIIVSNDMIQHPVAIRYNWGNTPDGNVFNKEGLPAAPFRAGSLARDISKVATTATPARFQREASSRQN